MILTEQHIVIGGITLMVIGFGIFTLGLSIGAWLQKNSHQDGGEHGN